MPLRPRLSSLLCTAACLAALMPAAAFAADENPPAAAERPPEVVPDPATPAPPSQNPPPPAAQSQQPPAEAVVPAVRETLEPGTAFRTLGREVKGASGIVVAQLVNVLVNAEGQPVAAVLDYGGFLGVGKRRIAVAWRALQFSSEGIALSLSREQLRDLPELKENEPVVVAAPPPASDSAARTQPGP